jgi:hypothetical protein
MPGAKSNNKDTNNGGEAMSKAGFKELKVWQRAKGLAVTIYKLTDHGLIRRNFGLIDQMRRSAVSVPSNMLHLLTATVTAFGLLPLAHSL